ncbi:MAG: hypothetical protein AAF997_06090 [Myxococcota bacterium]
MTSMRVSLRPSPNPTPPVAPGDSPPPMLEPEPRVVLGAQSADLELAAPITPTRSALFGPRGAALASAEGPLAVCDTGHHRLLLWQHAPDRDDQPADVVIGQPDFRSEGRNAKGKPGPATLNVPTGVAFGGEALVVADAWNHRVLIWRSVPVESHQPADVVLGQADFHGVEPNRGGQVSASTLNWCYGVSIVDGRLIVADTGNRRVLVWNQIPTVNGAAADLVIGQHRFDVRDEGAGADAGPLGMRWPHSVAVSHGRPMVADAGNNRVMVWETWPDQPGVPCDFVLGQADLLSLEHNRGAYWPDERSLNMPYGLTVCAGWVVTADTANSRILGWREESLAPGGPAAGLAGQLRFRDKGDNRWARPSRNSLCWPYWVSSCDQTLIVSDSGNNRVMLWELAP